MADNEDTYHSASPGMAAFALVLSMMEGLIAKGILSTDHVVTTYENALLVLEQYPDGNNLVLNGARKLLDSLGGQAGRAE